jgi:hypothetical protein
MLEKQVAKSSFYKILEATDKSNKKNHSIKENNRNSYPELA